MKYIIQLTDEDLNEIIYDISDGNLIDMLDITYVENGIQIIYVIQTEYACEYKIATLFDYKILPKENYKKYLKYMLTKFGIKYIIDLSKQFQFVHDDKND